MFLDKHGVEFTTHDQQKNMRLIFKYCYKTIIYILA